MVVSANAPPSPWQDVAEIQTITPAQSPPAPPDKSVRKRRPWVFVFSLLLVLLLGGGGLLAWTYIPLLHPTALATPTVAEAVQRSTPGMQQIVPPTPSAEPTPLIEAGHLLYQNAALYPACSGDSNSWSLDTNVQAICGEQGTILHNTSSQRYLATMFLNSINGYGIPNDYVLQVEAIPQHGSQGAFGVLFRNQPDQGGLRHNGAYTLMLDSQQQTWTMFMYDDQTGSPTILGTGSISRPLDGKFTIDLAVYQNVFRFFLNGQELGSVTDSTYPSGTLGFAVNPEATVLFQNLALYQPAEH